MTPHNRISRRTMMLGGASLLGAPLLARSARAQARTVYVNSYGGVWESSWKKAFFDPFTAQIGIAIKTVPGVSFAKLKAQVQTRNFEWDLVNLGDVEYAQAVLEGKDKRIDPALVERLVEDVGDDPSLLPLLQVTLRALWDEPPHRLVVELHAFRLNRAILQVLHAVVLAAGEGESQLGHASPWGEDSRADRRTAVCLSPGECRPG